MNIIKLCNSLVLIILISGCSSFPLNSKWKTSLEDWPQPGKTMVIKLAFSENGDLKVDNKVYQHEKTIENNDLESRFLIDDNILKTYDPFNKKWTVDYWKIENKKLHIYSPEWNRTIIYKRIK